jgi:hypothetical protein
VTTFAVYTTATGNLVSIGSTVANPLPAGLTALALTDPEALSLANGTGRWDPATRTVVPVVPTVQEVNRASLLVKAANAMAANDTFLAIANPNLSQTAAHTKSEARQLTAIIRLLLADTYGQADKLDTTAGT